MNFTQCIYIYLLATSLFCNGADQQLVKYKSIPFNRGVVDEPSSILYISNKRFAIAGDTGFEIQKSDQRNLNTFKRSPGPWHLKDTEKIIVAFNSKEIFIEDLNNKTNATAILMEKGLVTDVAIDSATNTIFIAYDNYPGSKSGIRQHDYNSH